jgi:hypothetical protein
MRIRRRCREVVAVCVCVCENKMAVSESVDVDRGKMALRRVLAMPAHMPPRGWIPLARGGTERASIARE